MSHGGGESGRVHEISHHYAGRKSGGGKDEFAMAIAKVAVAQICESAGFQGFQASALETLSEVAVRYLRSVGKAAQSAANFSGRTEGHVLDIIQALEELGSVQGFACASELDHCLASSGIVKDIIRYVGGAEHIPFAYSIPPFPIVREKKPAPSILPLDEEPPEEHIPSWLPAFPDPRTYAPLPVGNDGAADSDTGTKDAARILKSSDTSLLNWQRPFTCSGCVGTSFPPGGVERNPFLAPPLHAGEKQVFPVIPPANCSTEVAVRYHIDHSQAVGNSVSVMETFVPVIEAKKNASGDHEEGQRKVLVSQRPSVQFKIGIGKKSLALAQDFHPQKKDSEKISLWFRMDNEKDEKKRRAMEILKQPVKRSGELAQL